MNLQKRYLTYLALACVPALHGCLWENIHVDGSLDAYNEVQPDVARESSRDNSNEKEDNI